MKLIWCGQGTLRSYDAQEILHCKPERPIYCNTDKKRLYQNVIDQIMQCPVELRWRILKYKDQQYSFAEVRNALYGDECFFCGKLRFIQPVNTHFIYLIFDNILEKDNLPYPYIRVIYLFHEDS